jgi:hypothetical protein
LHLLRFDREEFAAILKVKFKEPSFKIEDLLAIINKGDKKFKVHLLERDNYGAFIYFLPGKSPNTERELMSFGGYPVTPFEVKDDKMKITFHWRSNAAKESA